MYVSSLLGLVTLMKVSVLLAKYWGIPGKILMSLSAPPNSGPGIMLPAGGISFLLALP